MNVVISELSSGFSDYSYILCNYLVKNNQIDKLTYLTDKSNFYFSQIDDRVNKVMLFDEFKADDEHKKGSIKWLWNRIITSINNCKRRNTFIKEEKPDSILVHATLAVFDSYFLKKLKGVTKIVLLVHDVIVPTKSFSWNRKSLKKMYDAADILVVHSKMNRDQLIKEFSICEDKIVVIPHGIKSTYQRVDKDKEKKELGIDNDKKVLLFYGGIRESKGLDILLNALKGLPVKLIIAGAMPYGEQFDKYQHIINSNKIDTLQFIQFTEDSFRDVLFQVSDFLVLPYKEFYSQSGVFMQAIQYHLPIIATDVSSFKYYVEHYDIGYICAPNNIDNLHHTIVKALSEEKEYESNMVHAINDNCWETTSSMYADVLSGGSAR